jgi:glycosyltransferase involved in cell wall biosynthesis
MKILVAFLEFRNYEQARSLSFCLGAGLASALVSDDVDVLALPLWGDLDPSEQVTWEKRTRTYLEGRRFDQVWFEAVHANISEEQLEFLRSLAPTLLGLVVESIHCGEELEPGSFLEERRARTLARLRHCTHVAFADERDHAALDAGDASTWMPFSAFASACNRPALPVQRKPHGYFQGVMYELREKFVQRAESGARLVVSRTKTGAGTPLPDVFEQLNRSFYDAFLEVTDHRPADELVAQYGDALVAVRAQLYDLMLDDMTQWACVVNLPTHLGGLTTRVFEAMALGLPVLTPRPIERPHTTALFEHNAEIVYYDAERPESLRIELDRILGDAGAAERIGKRGRMTIAARHTTERRAVELLRFAGGVTPGEARNPGGAQERGPSQVDEYCIRPGYVSRPRAEYFDIDAAVDNSGQVWQPDVYEVAGLVATALGATRMVDIGCGRADKLLGLGDSFATVGIDVGSNVAECRRRYPGRAWHDIDLETIRPEQLEGLVDAGCVVICSDVIEHLSDPGPLTRTLAHYAGIAAAVVTSTPERDLTRGVDDPGPPANPCHVREWAFDELRAYLAHCGFPRFAFYGLTRSNSLRDEWFTLISISSTREIGPLMNRITGVARVGEREYPVLHKLWGVDPAQIGREQPKTVAVASHQPNLAPQAAKGSAVSDGPRTSVFVLTVGDPAYDYCVAALNSQASDRFPMHCIKDVAPFSAAFQAAIDNCRTEFFIQVDEDMILFRGALEAMERTMLAAPANVGMICFHLYDDDLGHPIQGVKIFRRAALEGTRSQDVQTSEMDLLAQMNARGFEWVLHPMILGRHGAVYTKETIYRRYKAMYEKDIKAWNSVDAFIVKKTNDLLASRDIKDLYALLGAWHGVIAAPLVADQEAHNTAGYQLKELDVLQRLFIDKANGFAYEPARRIGDVRTRPVPIARLLPPQARVLVVCDHYWPFSGGVESIAGDLAQTLLARGYKVEVATAHTPARTSDEHRGVRIHGLDITTGKEPFVTNGSYQVRGMIESGTFQAAIVIGAPDSWSMLSLENLDRGRAGSTRVVAQLLLNAWGVERVRTVPRLEARLLNALSNARSLVALSPVGLTAEFLRRHQLPFAITPNATFAMNGDSHRFLARYGLQLKTRPIVLHLASLFPEKNHLEFLDHIHAHPDLDALFLFVGRPVPERPEYGNEFVARVKRDPRCHWITGIEREEVADAMAAASMLVLPSVAEVSPVCLLEAMASAIPWIASPQAGNAAELKGGIVCPVAEFPAAIGRLLADEKARRALGREGQAHWSEHHSWDAVGKTWAALIEGTPVPAPSPLRATLAA